MKKITQIIIKQMKTKITIMKQKITIKWIYKKKIKKKI